MKQARIGNEKIAAFADKLIPRHKLDVKTLVKGDADTLDIMQEVVTTCKYSDWQVKEFARHLRNSDSMADTCYNVWKFIRNNIPYRLDPLGYQFVNTPANSWHNRKDKNKFCDCKSYSVMAWSLLKALGIPCYRRFVSYDRESAYTHVYAIAVIDGKTIVIDACLERFNTEKKYKFKKDV